MKLNELQPPSGAKKVRKRSARGPGSGRGKTAGRGHKGQRSRSGFSQGAGWEGGRSRLIMRLPKRGFNRHKIPAQVVNLRDLNRFENGTSVTPELLLESGLVGSASRPIKILGDGELEVKGLRIEVVSCSRSAIKMIEAAGGSVSTAVKSEPEESS